MNQPVRCLTHPLGRATERFASIITLTSVLATAVLFASPLSAQALRPFDTGIVVGGDWMQVTALPLDRDAFHSGALTVSFRRQKWAADVGWLRIARTLSTIQGGYASGGPLLIWKSFLFIPTVGVLGGRVEASRDSTGYNFVDADGIVGHQARYSYSSGATFGGSVGLTVEYPVHRIVGIRVDASEWLLSGAPLDQDHIRTVVGVGLSLRVGR